MKRSLIIIAALLATLTLPACQEKATAKQKNDRARTEVMERATEAVPVPRVNNFLTREYVAKWMHKMDDPSKVFYVYLLADTGNPVGYYVGTRPISICSFMTPTVEYYQSGGSLDLGPAPALDGVYYGAGGNCDTYFMFDAATDAVIHFSGFKYFTSDEPLSLDAEPIRVAATPG